MNRVFTSIILALGLINSAAAQSSSNMSQPQDPNEVIVLSSYVDGNYNVERLLVMESNSSNNEFVMRYKINITKFISTYDNNSAEIEGLHNFIESIKEDSLKRITSYDIMGYASPDGPSTLNLRLADERAKDFNKFIDQKCDMSDYPSSVTGNPYKWIDTKAALQSSSVPNKSEILSIIESSTDQRAIESQIKTHDAAWEYIKENILPPMRSVEIHIKYNSWKIVENRTLIEVTEESAAPAASTVIVNVRNSEECAVEDDYLSCILIEMPDQPIDFDCGKEHEKLKAGKHGAKYKERGEGVREKVKVEERKKRKRWWKRNS